MYIYIYVCYISNSCVINYPFEPDARWRTRVSFNRSALLSGVSRPVRAPASSRLRDMIASYDRIVCFSRKTFAKLRAAPSPVPNLAERAGVF